MKYAALIPIKDHSERVPGKNFRPLAGRPLWMHVVAMLHQVDQVARIYIDTDSMRFADDVLAPFPKVELIIRPQELRGDFVSTNRIFEHDLTRIDSSFDHLLQTHTTNPLLTAETVARAIAAFEEAERAGTADSLFSVTPHFARFYRRSGEAVNHDPAKLIRTQDLDPLLEENSNLYLFTRGSFHRTKARIGAQPLTFEMDAFEAVDIDDARTWKLAEWLCESAQDKP